MSETRSECLNGAWPVFDAEMVEAAAHVLRSGIVNYWSGPEGRCFEAEFSKFLGVAHSVAVTNGTAALELALRAMGIRTGDDVVISPRSFIASASSVIACGARPVFADVDRDSGNIRADTIEAVLTPATRAVVVVHLGGWPCELDPIVELARVQGIRIVEDVAQAHGGTYKGRPLGSVGDVGTFSFCNDKIVSTGEGGLLTTNHLDIFRRVWSLRDNGRNWEAMQNCAHSPGFRWVRSDFGTNCRMTEMQSAIGRVALRRLPDWTAKRRNNARVLAERLGDLQGVRVPTEPEGHAHYRLYVYVRPERLVMGWSRDRILAQLLRHGVPCSVGSCGELYLEEAFERANLRPAKRRPVARELGETSLAFAVHPTLTESDMHHIGDVVETVLTQATA